jgi:protein SCO1
MRQEVQMKMLAKPFVSALALAAAGMIGPMASVTFAEDTVATGDPHAHHHMVMPETTRRIAEYTVPQVRLVRDDGKPVSLPEELNDGRPVVLSFIYTTCTTVCPLVSQTFLQLQRKLGTDRDRVHLVSISIDPEQDTPARLAAYAKKFGAGPEWQHYTGTLSASIATQRAFDVYRGDKMNHSPVTLLRAAPDKPWVRIEGFATADGLLAEVKNMLPPTESPSADVR